MKKVLLFLFACSVLAPLSMKAQFDEFGIVVGTSNYSGELTERRIEPLEFNMAQGIFLRRHLSRQLGLKVQLARMVVSGDDRNNPVSSDIWERNLNFYSNIFELGVQAEWIPLKLKSGDNQFEPYVFGGVAGFYFSPRTVMDDKTYELHHYKTEGVDYSLFQVSIPFGTGLRFNIRKRFHVGMELGLRKTFTDYLDDVSNTYRTEVGKGDAPYSLSARLSYRAQDLGSSGSKGDDGKFPLPGTQRGNPKYKDWYMMGGITISMDIPRGR